MHRALRLLLQPSGSGQGQPLLLQQRHSSRGTRVAAAAVPAELREGGRGTRLPGLGASRSTSSESAGPQPQTGSYGARFVRDANRVKQRGADIRSGRAAYALHAEAPNVQDQEKLTREQIRKLLRDLPGHISCMTAYILHCRGAAEPVVQPPQSEEEFAKFFREERNLHWNKRRSEITRRRRTRRNFAVANTGYKEEDEVHEADPEVYEFSDEWRLKSIVEDVWKAEFYSHVPRQARELVPPRDSVALRSDRVADVAAEAFRKHIVDQNRPVLTHELADFENPYMMKRSALERLLQERCVRSPLQERVLPRLLDESPDLVKLRAQAALPPEVLEPLAAFRGDRRWHFDSQERLAQKLGAASAALDAVTAEASASSEGGGSVASVVASLPENEPTHTDQVPGLHHPWRNHVGFESAVPRGTAGGNKFGQPMQPLEAQLLKLRYPTLQRVAHSLPADPKWRAHVVRTVRVLERSKGWDFQSKLKAVNKLKEVYDYISPSQHYTEGLDKKLVVNWVPSRERKRYAPNADYYKRFPRKFMNRKSWLPYRPSLTAREPMTISSAKLKLMSKR